MMSTSDVENLQLERPALILHINSGRVHNTSSSDSNLKSIQVHEDDSHFNVLMSQVCRIVKMLTPGPPHLFLPAGSISDASCVHAFARARLWVFNSTNRSCPTQKDGSFFMESHGTRPPLKCVAVSATAACSSFSFWSSLTDAQVPQQCRNNA
jgi:hypothetical protein